MPALPTPAPARRATRCDAPCASPRDTPCAATSPDRRPDRWPDARPDAPRAGRALASRAVAKVGTLVGALLLMVAGAAPAAAHDFRIGPLVVDHPYALAGSGSLQFKAIRNTGAQPDRLLGLSTPQAGSVAMLRDGRPDTPQLPPGQALALRHDGPWRFALQGLAAPLQAGQTLQVTLRFEQAGSLTVPVTVVAPRTDRGHGHEAGHGSSH